MYPFLWKFDHYFTAKHPKHTIVLGPFSKNPDCEKILKIFRGMSVKTKP